MLLSMNTKTRKEKAIQIFDELSSLQAKWDSSPLDESKHRENLKILETKIATIRFIQSEQRLRQQLWIAIPSILGGSIFTLLLQYFVKLI
jgi:hypothetical protein